MRHIALNDLLNQIFASDEGEQAKGELLKAHFRFADRFPTVRQRYVRRNGARKWSAIKNLMIAKLGRKCWYTEVEIIGADLTIDHYRPICEYWFLAFDSNNYRIASPYSNSPHHNAEHGCAGGKGDNFPLLGLGQRATGRNKLRIEKPVILDPCNQRDCELLAFQADGRPILNPKYSGDQIAVKRVDDSKILLNLDHPEFNAQRERLYHDTLDDVKTYEELPAEGEARIRVRDRIKRRLSPSAAFSTAARHYVRMHRHLNWVEELLKEE